MYSPSIQLSYKIQNLFGSILIVIVILSIFIFLFFRNKTIDTKEHFYTLFYPYYEPALITKYNSLKTDSNIDTFNLRVITSPKHFQSTHTKLFLKSLLAYKYPIINIELLAEYNYASLNSPSGPKENTMAIIPAPILNKMYQDTGSLEKYKFLTSLDERYIYIFAPKGKNIDTIPDLEGLTIGVGEKGGLWEICANDVFKMAKINYKPFYGTLREMIQNIYNGKISAFLITDSFPSKLLTFIFYNFYGLHLIALDKIKFMDYYYTRAAIDLAKLSPLYLPNATHAQKHNKFTMASSFNNFNREEALYQTFNPLFTTFKYSNYAITNNNMNDQLGYLLTDHIFNNALMLKKSENAFTVLPIQFQNGAKKYYIEHGLITNDPDERCIYFYGKNACNAKTLGNLREQVI